MVTGTNDIASVTANSAQREVEGSYTAAVMASSPVGYYRLDSFAYEASDRSGNGNYLDQYPWGASPDGGAIYQGTQQDSNDSFKVVESDEDGAGLGRMNSDRAYIYDFTGSQPFSLELWAKYDASLDDGEYYSDGGRALASKWSGTGGYRLYVTTPGGTVPELCMQLNAETPYCLPLSKAMTHWHQYGASWDGTHISLFVDGQLLGTSSATLTGPTSVAGNWNAYEPGEVTAWPFAIGSDHGRDFGWAEAGTEVQDYWAGYIDEASVYDTALSTSDMYAHFAAGQDTADTTGYYVPGPPVNVTPPSINQGTYVLGEPMTAVPGTWTGFPQDGSITPTYQWQRCSVSDVGDCTDITGATGSSYTPGNYDEQSGMRVVETIDDGYGSASADSGITPPIGISADLASCHGSVHATNSCGKSGDPVNDATGALDEQMTDASLPGPGMGWSLTRSYSSDAVSQSSILGAGWSIGLDASLSVDSDTGNVTFNTEDGATIVYTPTTGGDYLAPVGVTSTLHELEDDSFTVTRQDGVVYNFSSAGVWDSMCDRNSNCITYTRNSDGHVTSLTDTAGRTVTFDYTGSGSSIRLEDINLPDSKQVTYTYDSSGNLATVTNIEGDETQYTYDSSHRITDKYDGNDHHVYHNVYGSDGRITSQTNALGYTTSFSWDADTQVLTTTDARGKQRKSYYAGNVLQKRVDPLGRTTSYIYDSELRPIKIIDPLGHVTEMTYDTDGNVLTSENVTVGTTVTSTYNSLDEPLTVEDARGKTTDYTYDSAGNLLRVVDPLDRAMSMTYYSDGQLETKKTGETYDAGTDSVSGGETTSYSYDSTDNLEHVVSPSGADTSYVHDALGRETSVVDPRGNETGATPADYTTSTVYADSADTVTTTDPLGDATVTSYDHAGNRVSVENALGQTTEWAYDAGDRLTDVCPQTETDCSTSTDPKTHYGYDDVGNMTSRTDPDGKTTTYAYDDANQLLSTTTPAGHVTSQTYDADGQLATTTDAIGNATTTPITDGVTTYSFDASGNVLSRDYSDSGTPDVSSTFDADGNRLSMTDGHGESTYAYDDANELTDVCPTVETDCATSTDPKTHYTYNTAGQITERSYPGGMTIDYTYWPDGELHTVTQGGLTATFTYDAAGNLTEIDHGNGLVETRTYDHAGGLTQIQTLNGSTVVYQADYTLDALGRPSKIVRSGDQDITWSYSYDAQGRITDACREAETDCHGSSDAKLAYSYDADGNRLTSTDLAGDTTSYAYDTAGENELTTVTHPDTSTTAYSYDADGRQTAAGDTTYAYNEVSQLTSASTSGVTGSVSFTYDGDGNRLARDDTRSGGQDLTYTWDENGSLPEVVSENDATTGDPVRSYTRAGNLPLWMQAPDGEDGTTTLDYQTDSLGSVVGTTDSSGDTACDYAYDPNGNPDSSAAGSGVSCADGVSPANNTLGYAGEEQDATGLYNLRAREYDPMLGQMLTTDPIDHSGGASAYQYADDEPMALVDPGGMAASHSGVWSDITNFATNHCPVGGIGEAAMDVPGAQEYMSACLYEVHEHPRSGDLVAGPCVNAGTTIGSSGAGEVQTCALAGVSFNPYMPFMSNITDSGVSATGGGGFSRFTARGKGGYAMPGFTISNAHYVHDQQGVFGQIGGNVDGVSGGIYSGPSCDGEVTGINLGYGPGEGAQGSAMATLTATNGLGGC